MAIIESVWNDLSDGEKKRLTRKAFSQILKTGSLCELIIKQTNEIIDITLGPIECMAAGKPFCNIRKWDYGENIHITIGLVLKRRR